MASAVEHISPDDPPLMILHGEKDPIVPLKQSTRLRDLYQQAKLNVSLEIIPNGDHVPWEFWDQTRQNRIREFFNRHLKANE